MTYEFNVVVPPIMHSFCPMSDQAQMIGNINRTKNVTFEVSTQTKTSLSVMVSNGQSSFACGYIPKECENLKFHNTTRCNIWNGTSSSFNYFKVLKSQKWPEFKYYLTKLLDSMHLNVDGVLNVYVELPVDIRERLEAPSYG